MHITRYTGPADGSSHYNPQAARWIRPGVRAVMGSLERIEVSGQEHLPAQGSHLLVINHQTYLDAPTMLAASDRDIRYMAAKDQFEGVIGQAMTAMGTFPVEKGKPLSAIRQTQKLLEQGHMVGGYPEGRLHGPSQGVHTFQEGLPMAALKSQACESAVPAAIHYAPGQATLGQTLASYAAAAGVTALSLAATAQGGMATTAALALSGALAGGVLRGGLAASQSPQKDIKNMALAFLGTAWQGALAGGVLAGLGGEALQANGMSPLILGAPLSGLNGLATLATAKHLSERQVAKVSFGEPIPLQAYRALPDQKEAQKQLTADLQAAVGGLKRQLEEQSC